jgi:hypothetical protein
MMSVSGIGPPTRSGAGFSEWRLVLTLRLVGLIKFSGRACLHHLKGRRSACGAAGCWRVTVAVTEHRDGITYVSGGADYAALSVWR